MPRYPKMLSLVVYPDKRLRAVCEPVDRFDDELAALVDAMTRLMRLAHGVGLAAPQVGVLKRMFVCNHTGEDADNQVYINPTLVDLSGSIESEEGCLSLPGVLVPVRRRLRCTIRAYDATGKAIERSSEDLPARVWQHETEHLDGRLIIDRMTPTAKLANKKALKQLEDEFRQTAAAG